MRSALALLLLCACSSTTRQESVAPAPAVAAIQADDAQKLAIEHMQKQEWAAAIALLEQALAQDGSQAANWARLAYCEHSLGHYDKSLANWKKSLELQPGQTVVQYNLACAYARLGKRDAALDALDKAVALGFNDSNQLAIDTDLDTLRGEGRFKAMVAKMQPARVSAATPPAEMKQFAFWIGEWDVFTKDGKPAGKSKIEPILGGFAIQENWTGAGGMSGVSLNTYDTRTKKWRQHWVDDRGGVLDYVDGELADGSLTMVAKAFDASGTAALNRMTFTDLGEKGVRQFGEQSSDGGKTWSVRYELFYKPRAKS